MAQTVPSRVVLIGDSAVGKTSLLNRALHSDFVSSITPTIGANWHLFNHVSDGENFALQIWDTAGSEKYRALGPIYYRNASGAIVVYDITSRVTFQDVEGWVTELKDTAGANVSIVVVGNKSDLDGSREVSESEGIEWCEKFGYDFFEASAKTGHNAHAVFERLAERTAQRARGASALGKHLSAGEPKSGLCC
jgi:Ras-related protein Rab-11A/Rab family protein